MASSSLSQPLRRLWALETFSYSLRVFIALAATMGLCWSLDQLDLIIPLFLGIIASALAETDDNWQGRLHALWVTLSCFGIAAASVELLFPYPPLFALGLAGSAFSLIMLGALGERYAAIAQATLILSVYTMITVDHRAGQALNFWREPLLLVSGAAWYGGLSVVWSALFVHQPVEQALARTYRELARYFRLKAELFEPRTSLNIEDQRLALARQSGQVVAAMNAARDILLHRLHQVRTDRTINHYLRLYFLAQDLHERVTSSHYPYQELAETFFHSDVLFRCHHLLRLQARACNGLATAVSLRQPFQYSAENTLAMGDLRASLEYLRQQQNPAWRPLLRSLRALAHNLERVQNKLASANNPENLENEDRILSNPQPQNLKQALERVRGQLTPTSLRFRHALRMAIALVFGYVLLHAIHPQQGYWILLTTVFVCQPNYGATRIKLMQRITGTLVGLLVGGVLFTLFPEPSSQALFAVLAGVVFFSTRGAHYQLATAAITLLVLLCFNQVGNGYDLILPRLFDTLLGCLIAAGAVFWVLPDWQGRRLHQVLANTLTSNSAYLRQIQEQYQYGKRDDFAYRLARRNAHNAESALSTTVSSMLLEPEPFCREAEKGLRFLNASHTLLNYLSALGAYRESLSSEWEHSSKVFTEAAQSVAEGMDKLATALGQQQPLPNRTTEEETLAKRLEQGVEDNDEQQQLLCNQLALVSRQLETLRTAAQEMGNTASSS